MPNSCESFAMPARRDGYVKAMQAITVRRRSGPVLVYLSASVHRQAAPSWPRTLHRITADLPAGVVLDTFADAFPGGTRQYKQRWRDYAADLDGLIVFGTRMAEHTYLLGPGGRQELRTVVAAGLPVLLYSDIHGLIPVVDCKPERHPRDGQDGPCLELTAPGRWRADAPTLCAALQALTPHEARPTGGLRQAGLLRISTGNEQQGMSSPSS